VFSVTSNKCVTLKAFELLFADILGKEFDLLWLDLINTFIRHKDNQTDRKKRQICTDMRLWSYGTTTLYKCITIIIIIKKHRLMPWRRWWISALRQLQLHDYESGFSMMSCFEQVCQPQLRIGAVHRSLLLCCPPICSVVFSGARHWCDREAVCADRLSVAVQPGNVAEVGLWRWI